MTTYRYLILCSRTKKAFEPLKVRQHLRLPNSNICLEYLISGILFQSICHMVICPVRVTYNYVAISRTTGKFKGFFHC